MIQKIFYDICKKLELGTISTQPDKVTGGYMHQMYRLQTEKGSFALKLLNPAVMNCPDVFKNYQTAEALEQTLLDYKLPIVPALELHHKKMQCIDKQYFYVFDWIDGKALQSGAIQKTHCHTIGGLLAKIHKIETKNAGYPKNEVTIDWDFYIRLAHEKCPEIEGLLSANRERLYRSQKEGNNALDSLPEILCICNGDMDSKNVLWVDGCPKIIDLECLQYGNPFLELFELALCWSGYEHCCINYECLKAFITAYLAEYGDFQADWAVLYDCNNGRLQWLEYNVKRALRLEQVQEDEVALGLEQVKDTMEHVVYYDQIKEPLIANLRKWFS